MKPKQLMEMKHKKIDFGADNYKCKNKLNIIKK